MKKTTTMIAALLLSASAARAGLDDGLRLRYSFDAPPEESGGSLVVRDLSGNGNDGVVSGPSFVPDGRLGGAYAFDGQDDHVRAPHSASLSLGQSLTLAAWFYNVREPGASESQAPLIEWNEGDAAGVHLWTNTQGFQWGGLGTGANLVDDQGNDVDHVVSTADPARNAWHHLVVTYDHASGTGRVYLDGTLAGERDLGQFTPLTGQGAMGVVLGKRDATLSFLEGMLDELRVYDRALSAVEARALFDQAGRPVTVVSFSASPDGVQDAVRFSAGQTLHLRVADADLDPSDRPSEAALTLRQGNVHRTISLTDEAGFFTGAGSVPLSGFQPGEVRAALKIVVPAPGLERYRLVRDSKITIVP